MAEIRAGATDWWSEDAEALVRASAGSACVKAMSGRYSVAPARTPDSGMREEAVAATGTAAEVSEDAAAAESTAAAEPEGAAAAGADDGSWSMGGLTFRSMSGSPGKKPYERQREMKRETDADEEGDRH